jgi:site-specific DNA-methyltransferase (adenine-specific)
MVDDWKVMHGDCVELMRDQPDGSAHAVIMDPPYCSGGYSETARRQSRSQGVHPKFGWFAADNMGTAGLVFLLRSIAFEAVRVLRPGGSVCVFCDWRQVANLGPAIESAGLRWTNLVVWDKGSCALGYGFRARHELILHFTNGPGVYHDKSVGNVITHSRIRSNVRHHQTEKPIELLRTLVRVGSEPGGLVMDPFSGSGSTGCAAVLEGRRFIGYERDAGYCEVARKRIEMAARDPLSTCRVEEQHQRGLFQSEEKLT